MRLLFCRFGLLALAAAWLVPAGRCAADSEIFTQQPTVAASQVPKAEHGERSADASAAQERAKQDERKAAAAPKPQWIWGAKDAGADDRYWFRKEFEAGPAREARLVASCDNRLVVFLNGKRIVQGDTWQQPVRVDIRRQDLKEGTNEIVVEAANGGGPAGLVLRLTWTGRDGHDRHVVTDKTWTAAKTREAKESQPVAVLGELGVQPWGNVFAAAVPALASAPQGVFEVLPGFQVELLYTVPKETQGSWVALTFDDKGRIIASDQNDKGLYRITPPPIGSDQPTKVERLDAKITAAQGLLHAFGSLYVSVNGGPGSGFYRLRDTDGDDNYDSVEKLKDFAGGGEHGPHALRLAPDGQSIYVMAGNHTDPPKDLDGSRLPSNWGEDLLLPRQWDARGHARGRLAPGGWTAQTDPDGKTWTITSNGYRNAYDMAFNADGELFAYDADMEWDMGTPWYRPTRVVHATSGSEFGWRSGTGKWPTYYLDSLPAVVDLGPGSPVGVEFGYGAKFPAKYQQALYLLDWTFGTIYAVHLEPDGSSYRGEVEEFLSRTPLPLTDAAVGPDGALYFAVGGRGTQSELFRVTYVGDEATEPATTQTEKGEELRVLRRQLEEWHEPGEVNLGVLFSTIWRNLNHEDRFIGYAARVALEHRPVKQWRSVAFQEKDPSRVIQAAVALARQGEPSDQPPLLDALDRLDFASLEEQQKLGLLRAYSLAFIRLGRPDPVTVGRIAQRLDEHYPSKSDRLNRELAQVLVYLNSPTVISKTLALMDGESTGDTTFDLTELLSRNTGYGGPIAEMLANHPDL
ncbi:MAG: heme-binding protein, partial [Planctomycetes bacterium]|nr:heme-binding protein [Planctomycetota bacterium]